MKLSSAISRLSDDQRYWQRTLNDKQYEALQLVLQVLQDNVDIESWDEEYEENTPMCIHCSGNGCGSCKGTGEAKIK